ncbi:MAG: rod-binding protein [Alphaproteobacteria bacterium]|nr:rod-binding protein [Alphaproteobacteria bacterium]
MDSAISPASAFATMQASQGGVDKANALTRGIRPNTPDSEFDAISKDFEAVFMTEMIRPVFESMETDGMFGGGRAEEVYRGMMLDEYGKALSNAGGIGLASHVKEALIKMQGQESVAMDDAEATLAGQDDRDLKLDTVAGREERDLQLNR